VRNAITWQEKLSTSGSVRREGYIFELVNFSIRVTHLNLKLLEEVKMKSKQVLGLYVVGVLVMVLACHTSVGAAEVKLDLSSTLAPGSCVELAADKYKDIVEKNSGGRIEITRYPSAELYNPKAEVEALATGNLAMAVMNSAYAGGRSPIIEFIASFGGAGSWQGYDHHFRFLDLPRVRELVAQELGAKWHAKVLSMIPYGDSLIGNTRRPIHTVADYKGLKVRTAGQAQPIMYKELGMIPVDLTSQEVYMALQRGTIDGACSGSSRFYLSKWYEVTPYITQDYSLPYIGYWLSINLDYWDKLSKADQQILLDAGKEMETWSRSYVVKETAEFYKKMKESGKIKELYFFPPEEVAKISKITAPVMHALIVKRVGKEMGDELWSLLMKTKE
jgi:TRAP-type C4-dicarboxylate transport system substrate-binding protein